MRIHLLVWACVVVAANAENLGVVVEPMWGEKPLRFGECVLTNRSGQALSVTRLDLLITDLAARQSNGTWVSPSNQAAFVSVGEQRTRFMVSGLPPRSYDRVRFNVGVSSGVNHADPARQPAGHALNPNVNGLHWNWQGGYVFFAVEGYRQNSNGYSYHIATDQQLMTVDLPVDLDTKMELRLGLNLDRILPEAINDANATTHSREGDPLASELRKNIEHAFSVLGVKAQRLRSEPSLSEVLIASNATPYRFTMSSSFPRPALPLDNPLTEEGVELGKRLFNELLLSINGKQSCASCHQADAAFADRGKVVSFGAEGHPGRRNAMPLFNLAWKSSFFWDGRASSLRKQVLMPIQDKLEMHETLTNVVRELATTAEYRQLFARAFGSTEVTPDRIARGLEQFLLTQTSYDSRFDHVLKGEAKFTDEEQRGFELFHTEYDPRREQFGADCFHCHGGPLFQNVAFANNGLDLRPRDLGRFEVTKREGDQGKFAIPSLRNVAVTAPYMHDGRFQTLEAVVDHYSTGVKRSATLDPNLAKHPSGGIQLSSADKRALMAFLRTLTDERFREERPNRSLASVYPPPGPGPAESGVTRRR